MPDEPQYQRCPHCGAQNTQSAEFCTLCLRRFREPEPPEEAVAKSGLEATSGEEDTGQKREQPAGQEDSAEQQAAGRQGMRETRAAAGEMWADEALDPSLQFDLGALHSEMVAPRTRMWVRLALVGSALFVVLSLAVAVLGTLSYRSQVKNATPAEEKAAPAESPASPTQTQPPIQPQGSPLEHPDLTFAPPAGWRVEGNAANITLVSPGPPGSDRIDIASWLRQGQWPYGYVNGPLQATQQPAADQEVAKIISDYLSSSGVDGVSSVSYTAGGVAVQGVRGKDEARSRSWQAFGIVHGGWTYFILAQGPEPQSLQNNVEALLQSVRFKT